MTKLNISSEIAEIRKLLTHGGYYGIRLFCDSAETLEKLLSEPKYSWIYSASIYSSESTVKAVAPSIDQLQKFTFRATNPELARGVLEENASVIGLNSDLPLVFTYAPNPSEEEFNKILKCLTSVPKINIVIDEIEASSFLSRVVPELGKKQYVLQEQKRTSIGSVQLQLKVPKVRDLLENELHNQLLCKLTNTDTKPTHRIFEPLKNAQYEYNRNSDGIHYSEHIGDEELYHRLASSDLGTAVESQISEIIKKLETHKIIIVGGFGAGTDFLSRIALFRLGLVGNSIDANMSINQIFEYSCYPSTGDALPDVRKADKSGYLFEDLFDPSILKLRGLKDISKDSVTRRNAHYSADAGNYYPFGFRSNWLKGIQSFFKNAREGASEEYVIVTTKYSSFNSLKKTIDGERKLISRYGPGRFVEHYTRVYDSFKEFHPSQFVGLENSLQSKHTSSARFDLLKLILEHAKADLRWGHEIYKIAEFYNLPAHMEKFYVGHWGKLLHLICTADELKGQTIDDITQHVESYFETVPHWKIKLLQTQREQ